MSILRLISTLILSLCLSTTGFTMSRQTDNTRPICESPQCDSVSTASGTLEVYPIEHASFVIQQHTTDGHKITIIVDPVGHRDDFAAFKPADIILVTDIHRDHYDPDALSALVEADNTLIVPASVTEQEDFPAFFAGNIFILNNGDDINVDDIHISALPMYNEHDHPKGRGNGYLLNIDGYRMYISGDTENIEEMQALNNIDAAFMVMNTPYTMGIDEAAQAVLSFAPKIVYPYHYRNQDGSLSDIDAFTALVAANPNIEVRALQWYP